MPLDVIKTLTMRRHHTAISHDKRPTGAPVTHPTTNLRYRKLRMCVCVCERETHLNTALSG